MLSGKNRIRVAMTLVVAVTFSLSLISLTYMGRMASGIETMASVDARMAETGEWISIQMLEARRAEKNYVIYQDSQYVALNRNLIQTIRDTLHHNRPRMRREYQVLVDSIDVLLAGYGVYFSELEASLSRDPWTLSRIQKQMLSYESQFQKLAQDGSVDSLAVAPWLSDLQMAMVSTSSRLSTEKAQLFINMRDVGNRIFGLSQSMSSNARNDLRTHSRDGMLYSLKAQRNTWTLLFLALIVLVWMIVKLPQRIFAPYGRIIRALKGYARGDMDVAFPDSDGADEVALLSSAFQEAITQLKSFDRMKSEKIVEMQRSLTRLLDEIGEGVIVLSPERVIRQCNAAVNAMLNLEENLIGQPVKEVPLLWKLLETSLAHVEREGRSEFTVKDKLKKRRVTVIPEMARQGRLARILIIIQ